MTDDAERTKHPVELAADDDVPRLPRGRGLRLSGPLLVRLAGTGFVLVFLLMMQRPCANAVSTFVTGFGGSGGSDDRGSAAAMMPRPGTVDVPAGSAGSAAPGSTGSPGIATASAASAGAAGPGSSAGSEIPNLDQYEHLRPGMTEAEIKAVIERARIKAAGSNAAP